MPRRILRHELPIDDRPQELPAGKIVLLLPYRLAAQTGERFRLEAWVEANTPDTWPSTAPTGKQQIRIIATGQPIPDGATHLASTRDGEFIWHLYRIGTTK